MSDEKGRGVSGLFVWPLLRQFLGGPGWEGCLPHIPTSEGQEAGRPPSSPLCLLQQDWTFCGEPLLSLGEEACAKEWGWRQQGQREASRSDGSAQRKEPPAGQSWLCNSFVGSLPREVRGLALCFPLTSSVLFQIEEVPGEFMQEDLATDDVMLLDTWDQVGKGQKVKALWA